MDKLDNLKLIPQVFFDLIARVIPGATGIVACLLLTDTTWESTLKNTLGKSLATDSSTLAFLILLATAYVVGQLLSPAAKLIQQLGESMPLELAEKRNGAYDRLRLRHPSAGALCAKIRAEFTMHNGLAAVLFASAVFYPLRGEEWHWLLLCGLLLGALFTAYRGRTTRDTFHETVIKFDDAANESNSTAEQGDAPDRPIGSDVNR